MVILARHRLAYIKLVEAVNRSPDTALNENNDRDSSACQADQVILSTVQNPTLSGEA